MLLSLCINLVSFGHVFAADNTSKADDTAGHWAEGVLKQWQAQGLLTGYEDGSLKPDHKITRAEFAVLVNKSFGYADTSAITFKDVKPSDWFYTDIAKATSAGYITGYPDQTFKPNKALSREEMAVILSSLLQLKESTSPAAFTDTLAGHVWSKGRIGAVVEAGIIVGYDQKFRPLTNATRAESISVLDRALKFSKNKETVVYNKPGNYGPETGVVTITGSVYIEAPGIVLRNTIITGDLLIGEGVGKGDVSLKNVTVKGTTTITGGGKNSIHIIDSILVTVIVNKKDGSIRIVTEGASSVQQITLQSGALLEEGAGTGSGFGNVNLSEIIPANAQVALAGRFETVDVFATAIRVNLTSGSIQELQVGPSASNTGIDITGGASVNSLILNAIARVTGQGAIGTAAINVSGSTISQTPGNVIRGDNVSVTIGAPTVASGGSSNGGSSGGNPGSVTNTVYGFEGRITDVNDQPVAGVTIHFRKGLGATTGNIAATVVTDEDGHYFANLTPGIYTGQLVKSGFITTSVVGVSLTTHKNVGQDATAIKIPAADEIRIMLTWDLQPLDEDSHLIGPTPNNRSFHTWYGKKQYSNNGQLYADLDHDDTSSYGPETTTIRKRVDGTYTFYIHNFSSNGTNEMNTLSASGAKVQIYNGDNSSPVKIYHIPAGESKQLYWHVFNMVVDGNNLTFEDKNELTNTQPLAGIDIDEGPVSNLPSLNEISIENNPGAADLLKVHGLSAGDIVSVYLNEFGNPVKSVPVQGGADTIQLTGLNFGAESTFIYISVTSSGAQESSHMQVPVLAEADYAALGTTIADAFADHEVPGTLTVGESVYLANSPQSLPQDLEIKVLNLEPISSVSEAVYLYKDNYKVRLAGYNGTNEPVQYKVTLELRRGSSSVTKMIVLTVPTVSSLLQQSVAAANKLLNDRLVDENLMRTKVSAENALVNPESTVEEYIILLQDLNRAIGTAT